MWLLQFCALALQVSMTTPIAKPTTSLTAQNLRCENDVEPLGIDAQEPRLSWTPTSGTRSATQSAYRILVATNLNVLAQNKGDLWDTGKVESAEQNNIPYQGTHLESSQICYWKVQTWGTGSSPKWSKPSHWEMGLLHSQDWTGKWLNDGKQSPQEDKDFYANDPAPLFRKEFTLNKPIRKARLYLAGIGYSEASLNGSRVGNKVLEPGWTKFDKRVLYTLYDVTHQLSATTNCLGIRLGNGWYNPLPLKLFGSFDLRKVLAIGRPRVIAELRVEYTDGTATVIPTDDTWRVGNSEILRNNIYLGEVTDARLAQQGWDKPGFNDNAWATPGIATEPIGELKAPHQPPIRVTSTWHSVKLTEPHPGTYIYDLGTNFAGWAQLKLHVPTGTEIHLRYGELLHPDGTLNPMTGVAGQIKGTRQGTKESVGGPGAPPIAWQSDTYIASGGEETYTPRFTFHAFRYLEITGLTTALPLESVTALRLNAGVEPAGSFECSNPLLNEIQTMCIRTFKSNIFSVQSDCPHRERLGYGGDIVSTSDAFISNFNMSGFYSKAVQDWSDNALPDGMFTDTAPSVGIQYCGVIWAMAHPVLLDKLHKYYGDRSLAEQEYPAAKRWIQLVEKQYPDGIVTDGLSDHESLVATPAPELVTPMYYHAVKIIASMATRLLLEDDAARFNELAAKIRKAYQAKCVNAETGKVGPGSQASQAIALYTHIVDDSARTKVLEYLLNDIELHRGHLTTGILGTKCMLEVLSQEGHADVAYRIATQTDFPSWGWMLKNGATTLWEHWEFSDNTFSHNHPMFGSISQWMIQWLGGIHPSAQATGFDQIIIAPQTPAGLNWVKSSYNSIRGKISSNWSRQGNQIKYEIEIPANSTAQITLPASSLQAITEAETPIQKAPGISHVSLAKGKATLTLGSGSYVFRIKAD
jgi:alpha-L-rhamnosidase